MTDDTELEPYHLDELSWPEVETAVEETTTMLLPVGSTEQHGRHMPLGVDTQIPEAVADRVASRTPALVAPPIHYGVSPHHTFNPGTFTVSTETFQRYVRDVCASAADWGVENVLLLNGHYLAQDPELEIVVRRLRNEHDLRAFHVSLVALFADVAENERASECSFHASEFETAIMLELFPELVEMDRAQAVDPPAESLPLTDYDALGDNEVGWALTAEDMDELTPAGNVGDPSVATAETGAKLVEAMVSKLTRLVEELEDER